jgi:predicted DNA-binding protein
LPEIFWELLIDSSLPHASETPDFLTCRGVSSHCGILKYQQSLNRSIHLQMLTKHGLLRPVFKMTDQNTQQQPTGVKTRERVSYLKLSQGRALQELVVLALPKYIADMDDMYLGLAVHAKYVSVCYEVSTTTDDTNRRVVVGKIPPLTTAQLHLYLSLKYKLVIEDPSILIQ